MSDVNAVNIQFWKVVEATARLAACSIKAADFTGNDAVALHSEGIAALQVQLQKIVGDIPPKPSIQELWAEKPFNPSYLTSEVALEITAELIPKFMEAIHKRGLDGCGGERRAILDLMATSLSL